MRLETLAGRLHFPSISECSDIGTNSENMITQWKLTGSKKESEGEGAVITNSVEVCPEPGVSSNRIGGTTSVWDDWKL